MPSGFDAHPVRRRWRHRRYVDATGRGILPFGDPRATTIPRRCVSRPRAVRRRAHQDGSAASTRPSSSGDGVVDVVARACSILSFNSLAPTSSSSFRAARSCAPPIAHRSCRRGTPSGSPATSSPRVRPGTRRVPAAQLFTTMSSAPGVTSRRSAASRSGQRLVHGARLQAVDRPGCARSPPAR